MSESVSGMVGFEGEAGGLAQLEAATSGLPPGNDGARTNWLWLAEISRWERALDLGRDGAPQMAGLAEHFRSVHYLGFDRSTLGRAWTRLTAQGYANVAPACATPLTLPYRDGTFDCVTLDEEYAGATLLERSEEHTSELQSHSDLVCRLLLEKKKSNKQHNSKQ